VGGQRFVMRNYSPVTTIGGGVILNPLPQRKKRKTPNLVEILSALASSNYEEKILALALEAEERGVSKNFVPALVGGDPEQIGNIFDGLIEKAILMLINPQDKIAVHSKLIESMTEQAVKHVAEYHNKFSHRDGILRAELEEKLKPSELASKAIDSAAERKLLFQHEKWVRLPDFSVHISSELEHDLNKLEQIYKSSGAMPPTLKEISEHPSFSLGALEILELAVRLKKLAKISEDIYYHYEVFEGIKSRLIEYFRTHSSITIAQFRDLFGFSRKFAVPLLEYFDTIKLTVRLGDERTLRK